MIAELVCGPAGCGKTTYCEGRRQYLSLLSTQRAVINVNLDPANDGVFPYPCDVDVREIASHHDIALSEGLGPNGSYLFCAELVAERVDELIARIRDIIVLKRGAGLPYLIIDAPGQVEFYLQTECIHRVLHGLEKEVGCSVCVVHLHDAIVATRSMDAYVSACLLVLTFMVQFELPQVNFLSKWDCVGDDALDYISVGDVLDHFSLLSLSMASSVQREFAKAIISVVDGYSIVGFTPLAVEDPDSMRRAASLVSHALGFL